MYAGLSMSDVVPLLPSLISLRLPSCAGAGFLCLEGPRFLKQDVNQLFSSAALFSLTLDIHIVISHDAK